MNFDREKLQQVYDNKFYKGDLDPDQQVFIPASALDATDAEKYPTGLVTQIVSPIAQKYGWQLALNADV